MITVGLLRADDVLIPEDQQKKADSLHLTFEELRIRNIDGKLIMKARNTGTSTITSLSLSVNCYAKNGGSPPGMIPFKGRLEVLAPGQLWKVDRLGFRIRGCVLEDLAGSLKE
jgi:hypothetical protein